MSDRPSTFTELSGATAEAFIANHDAFIFDCDGVLWRGGHLVPGAREALERLRSLNKRVFFVTNNSTKSRQTYLKVFAEKNIHASAEEILSASYAAALYLNNIGFAGTVHVVGEKGICEELDAAGIAWVGGPQTAHIAYEDLLHMKMDERVGAVVVGQDTSISYSRLAIAQQYILNPAIHFIATNTDSSYPTTTHVLPGSGVIVSALECAGSRKALVVGKPNPLLLDLVIEKFGVDRKRCAMIGDRLDTDVLFGLGGGLTTVLVETGVSRRTDCEEAGVTPHFVASSVDVLNGEQAGGQVERPPSPQTTVPFTGG